MRGTRQLQCALDLPGVALPDQLQTAKEHRVACDDLWRSVTICDDGIVRGFPEIHNSLDWFNGTGKGGSFPNFPKQITKAESLKLRLVVSTHWWSMEWQVQGLMIGLRSMQRKYYSNFRLHLCMQLCAYAYGKLAIILGDHFDPWLQGGSWHILLANGHWFSMVFPLQFLSCCQHV